MQRSENRILTTHTGSLPRPPALTQLYARRARGETADERAIEQAGRDALRDVVAKQIEVGLDIVNNGEQQRESFVLYLRHRLAGLGGSGTRLMWADVDAYPDFKAAMARQLAAKEAVSNREFIPKTIGEIAYVGESALESECADFIASLARYRGRFTEAFLTAPSPGIVAAIAQNEHYATQEAHLEALGRALAHEYETIVGRGFVLQIDAPDLGLERHGSYRHRPLSDFLTFCELVIATINEALRNVPPERVRLHVCWGNYEGPHDHDVPLREILPIIRKANVGAFVLPFANPRHAHEFRCFAEMPLASDQILVAGVIDTLTNFVEHPEVVADRIERVAHVIGEPARVMAGTDCGFDTSAGMGRVAADVVWAKLAALCEGASIASSRLFA